MILNRQILREHIEDERLVIVIMRKAVKFNLVFDKMAKDVNGSLHIHSHFKKDEWIECQEKFIKTLRVDCIENNKRILKVVKEIK